MVSWPSAKDKAMLTIYSLTIEASKTYDPVCKESGQEELLKF